MGAAMQPKSQTSTISCCRTQLLRIATCRVITSPAGAVKKYCDQRVCVCLSVCPPGYLRNHKHDLCEIFCACCLWPWLGPPPARWRTQEEGAVSGVFFPTDNAL